MNRLIAVGSVIIALLSTSVRAEIPGAHFKDAYTDRQAAMDTVDFDRRHFLELYNKIGATNPVWGKDGADFLNKSFQWLAYEGDWPAFQPDDTPAARDIARLGEALLAKRCDNPLVRCFYGMAVDSLRRDPDAVKQFRFVIEHAKNEALPPELIVSAAARLRRKEYLLKKGESDALRKMVMDNCLKLAVEHPSAKHDRSILFDYYRDALRNRRPLEEEIVKALRDLPGADPWFVNMAIGQSESTAAWTIRPPDPGAPKVNQQILEDYKKRLVAAHNALDAAWRLEPMLPGPARRMLPLGLDGGFPEDESFRKWFVHALQAKLDDREAFAAMLQAMRPGWGGSIDEMFSLGQEAAESDRYDTSLPAEMMLSIDAIADDQQDRQRRIWTDDRYYEPAAQVFAKYEISVPPGRRRDWFRSWHAAVAWRAGKYPDARKQLDQLTTPPALDRFASFTNVPRVVVSYIYAITGPHADLAKLITSGERGNIESHAQEIEALAKTLHDPSTFFFEHYVQVHTAELQLAEGKWLDVLPKESVFHYWEPKAGLWTIDANGELVGQWDEAGLLLRSTLDLNHRYEVQAVIEYEQKSPSDPTGVGFALDHDGTTSGYGLVVSPHFKDYSRYVNFKGVAVSAKIPATNEIHLQFWDNRFNATLNGRKLNIPRAKGKLQHVFGPSRLAIYSLYPGSAVTIHVKAIKVRLLDRPPEGLEDRDP